MGKCSRYTHREINSTISIKKVNTSYDSLTCSLSCASRNGSSLDVEPCGNSRILLHFKNRSIKKGLQILKKIEHQNVFDQPYEQPRIHICFLPECFSVLLFVPQHFDVLFLPWPLSRPDLNQRSLQVVGEEQVASQKMSVEGEREVKRAVVIIQCCWVGSLNPLS